MPYSFILMDRFATLGGPAGLESRLCILNSGGGPDAALSVWVAEQQEARGEQRGQESLSPFNARFGVASFRNNSMSPHPFL